MKSLILGLAVAATLGAAAPALAHDEDGQRATSDWNYNSGDGEFADDLAHIREGIQHGLSDGSFSRWEAARFNRELGSIERQISGYDESDGAFSPWERGMIQRRIDRLHSIMHVAHDQSHDRNRYGNYGYGNNGYGNNGYGNNGYGNNGGYGYQGNTGGYGYYGYYGQRH
ncbi:MAG TPA: hypothetical protein VF459_08050 [Caulobacteraceae bacterium]